MATNALDHSNPRTIASAMIIALAVTIASLLVTVAVVASLQLGASSATQPGSGVPLGLQDDYALRHAVTAPALGSQDDYALRHSGDSR